MNIERAKKGKRAERATQTPGRRRSSRGRISQPMQRHALRRSEAPEGQWCETPRPPLPFREGGTDDPACGQGSQRGARILACRPSPLPARRPLSALAPQRGNRPACNHMPLHLAPGKTPARDGIVTHRDSFRVHPAPIARKEWMPRRKRPAAMQTNIRAGFRKPVLMAGHRGRRQVVADRHPLQPIDVVAAAGRLDVEQLAGHAVHRHRMIVHPPLETALATTITEGFPLPAVELPEGVLLPETITHCLAT